MKFSFYSVCVGLEGIITGFSIVLLTGKPVFQMLSIVGWSALLVITAIVYLRSEKI